MCNAVKKFRGDTRGTSAIEFAIVGPVFLGLVIGLVYLSLMLFSMGSLQYTVQDAARCASVQSTVCPDDSSTVAFAQNAYLGVVVTPTFTSTNAACGHLVNGSVTFPFNFVLGSTNVPMSASACFP